VQQRTMLPLDVDSLKTLSRNFTTLQ
jgi:hypothetical protein